MKFPGVVTIVRDGHPRVVGHHVVVDCQDGFAIRSEIEDEDGCFKNKDYC